MEEKTAIFEQQGRKVRFMRKHAKTKTMKLNSINSAKINMRGVEREDGDQFTYLGSIVSKEGGTDQDSSCWKLLERQQLYLRPYGLFGQHPLFLQNQKSRSLNPM